MLLTFTYHSKAEFFRTLPQFHSVITALDHGTVSKISGSPPLAPAQTSIL